jgi:DNA-binding transcriptional LysR family regulator
MDTDLLRCFVAVAETKSFSAAARRLHCTQAAVSLRIKRLEERLGAPLFARTSRAVTLTDSGATLLAYAGRLLRLNDEAAAAVGASAREPRLRFGISDEQAMAYLPAVLPRFVAAMPEVQLEVRCDVSTALAERVREGQLDLALAIRHDGTPGGELIGREALYWVAAEGFAPAPGRPLPLAVNPEGCVYRATALEALAAAGRRWQIVYTSESPTGINIAVQLGMGATVKPRRSVPAGCAILGAEVGLPPLRPVEVELHRASRSSFPMAARVFRDLLLETMAVEEDASAGPTPVGLSPD